MVPLALAPLPLMPCSVLLLVSRSFFCFSLYISSEFQPAPRSQACSPRAGLLALAGVVTVPFAPPFGRLFLFFGFRVLCTLLRLVQLCAARLSARPLRSPETSASPSLAAVLSLPPLLRFCRELLPCTHDCPFVALVVSVGAYDSRLAFASWIAALLLFVFAVRTRTP